jgi:hypothetical protein
MTYRLIAAAAALSFAAGGAIAGEGKDFASLDADKSGALSLAEVQAASPDATAEEFAAYDAGKSGHLSTEEFAALEAAAKQ